MSGFGGFGGQQGGFGGGYGMPRQQQSFGGFNGFGGFGMPQQSFGGFGGFGMPQQSFGGFGGFGMPQQSFGGFGGFGMPQQGFGGFSGFGMPQQSFGGFGGGYQLPRQRFNRQQQQQPMTFPQAPQTQVQPPIQTMRDPFQLQISGGPVQETLTPAQQASLEKQRVDQYASLSPGPTQEQLAQNAARVSAEQQPQPSGGRGFDFGFDPTQSRISGGPVSDPMQDAYQAFMNNREGRADNAPMQPQMRTQPPAPNPYSQQVGQEDPRLQAMRNMQQMNLGK